MVQEAVEVWCEGENLDLPEPTTLEELASNTDFTGGFWMAVDVDVSRLDVRQSQKPMRINISLPEGWCMTSTKRRGPAVQPAAASWRRLRGRL